MKPSAPIRTNLKDEYFQKQRKLFQQEVKPSWITDKLKIKDIEGTQSDVYGSAKFIRGSDNHLNTEDIIGARPRSRPKFINKPCYSLETSDLDSKRHQFRSRRNCNPLNPVYNVPQMAGQAPIEVGPIVGN